VKRLTHRSPVLQYPNQWLGSEETGTWECQYRLCYMTVIKNNNNKYVPSLHGSFDLSYDGVDLPASGKFEFDTAKEAQDHAWKYTNWMKDVYSKRGEEEKRQRLHKMRPDVHPA
jgi:hypothetical protein